MDRVLELLPSGEKGYLPYYLWVVSVVAIGNVLLSLSTLHYSRRLYNGLFVPNTNLPPKTDKYNPEDSVNKWVPVAKNSKDAARAKDLMNPLTGRLFGTYTFAVGLIRLYAAYDISHPLLYQLAIWTHVIAAVHFTSEMFYFGGMTFSGPQIFPFFAGYTGIVWMLSSYSHYVQA